MPHVRDCKYLDKWYLPMFVMGQISESTRLLVVYGVLILVVCCSGGEGGILYCSRNI